MYRRLWGVMDLTGFIGVLLGVLYKGSFRASSWFYSSFIVIPSKVLATSGSGVWVLGFRV